MFYIIGIGLSVNQITKEALDIISKSKDVYIDNYTNILSEGEVSELEKIINKKIVSLERKNLETEQNFLKDDSALLVIGNPFSATTHYTLIKDAKHKGIHTKIIPGISIFNYKGYTGLYEYKFGKTISIVYPDGNYKPTSFYNTLIENLSIKAHTLCLLDIKTDKQKFMTIKEACTILNEIDKENNRVLDDKECIALCKMGSTDQDIISFKFKDYNNVIINKFPQSLIICGYLNEFERDGLNEFKTKN
jgi:diphthine synthase